MSKYSFYAVTLLFFASRKRKVKAPLAIQNFTALSYPHSSTYNKKAGLK